MLLRQKKETKTAKENLPMMTKYKQVTLVSYNLTFIIDKRSHPINFIRVLICFTPELRFLLYTLYLRTTINYINLFLNSYFFSVSKSLSLYLYLYDKTFLLHDKLISSLPHI